MGKPPICVIATGLSLSLAADTILRADAATKFCIVETHASYRGVIAKSVKLLRPRIGAVTTIGDDHYTSYRSREATARRRGGWWKACRKAASPS